jgi:glucose/sorbosone dehydrogenase
MRKIKKGVVISFVAVIVVVLIHSSAGHKFWGKVKHKITNLITNPRLVKTDNSKVELLTSNLYDIEIKRYKINFPENPGLYGAIDELRGLILWATSYGDFYLLDDEKNLHKLNIPKINTNRADFINAIGDEESFVAGRWFALKDISVIKNNNGYNLFTSYHYWDEDNQCYTIRLSKLNISNNDIDNNVYLNKWEVLYETSPCLPLFEGDPPFRGNEAGGRIAHLDSENLFLTIGHHEFNGLSSKDHLSGVTVPDHPQDFKSSYGKIILVNKQDGSSNIYSSGHRNPQGLYISEQGVVFSTEHGPKGGDELNIIIKNGNYGWPRATYGTQYHRFEWPLSEPGSFHDGYEEPLFAWVPSVGISNLTEVKGKLFKHWKGDLLIGSLRGNNILRLKFKDNRVIYSEPILVDLEVRDILEMNNGTIVAMNRQSEFITMTPSINGRVKVSSQ